MDLSTRINKDCLFFKVYFENAYDRVNWDFLRHEDNGFCSSLDKMDGDMYINKPRAIPGEWESNFGL